MFQCYRLLFGLRATSMSITYRAVRTTASRNKHCKKLTSELRYPV